MAWSFLIEDKLYNKFSKCYFYQKEINYLGNIIYDEGIYVDLEKGEGHNGLSYAKECT